MRRDRSADIWSGAMHNIENAIWQTGFAHDLAQHVSRHWRQLARLGDGRVSDRKIDIVRVTVRNLRIRFASRRFDVVEIFATDRLKKLAVDEIPDASQYFCHNKQRAKRSSDCSTPLGTTKEGTNSPPMKFLIC